MKKVKFALVMIVMLLVASQAFAAIGGAGIAKTYETPFLLTSGGQGAGSKMLRLLITQTKKLSYGEDADFFLEDETPARYGYIDSGKYKALFVVMSVTEKGLGASGITIEDEIRFLQEVVKKAQAQNMPIVAVSLEADARKPGVPTNGNERVIDTICPYADWIITIDANNTDGRFTELGKKYNIPVTTVGKQLELVKALPGIFGK
ncbi:MAG: hypothetical protein KBS81_05815 [Spirochaetales bacterium]|nr:hypothetical protein [Candidatus Physcosoma equi]